MTSRVTRPQYNRGCKSHWYGFFMKDVQTTNLVQLLIVVLMNNIIPRRFILSENKYYVYNYNRLKPFTSKKQLTRQAQEDNVVSFRLSWQFPTIFTEAVLHLFIPSCLFHFPFPIFWLNQMHPSPILLFLSLHCLPFLLPPTWHTPLQWYIHVSHHKGHSTVKVQSPVTAFTQ